MYKRQILFCCLAQLTIVMSATTSGSGILTDSTPKSTVTESGSEILPDTTPITTVAGNCFYNGQMYYMGDIYKSIDDCNSCSCGWLGTTCTASFCPPKHSATPPGISRLPDIPSNSSAIMSSGSISSDFTSTSATSTTSTTISSESTYTTTTPMQCVYNGQVHNIGDSFIANDHCSICWCLSSQMICTMCPPQPSTSATSSTISPDTTTPTTAGQCVYNGQVYNDGDSFIASDFCQNYCWCMGSQMICTMCPPQTSASTTSSTISPDTTMTTTVGQCVYNGQVYNDGDNFIANDYCLSYCWCMDSQMICTMCPPQTSTRTSITISLDISTTTMRGQCLFNGQMYKDGDRFKSKDDCNYCYCIRSQIICTLKACPMHHSGTEKKRRRTTLLPALYTKTKKCHTDLFNTIMKKPHFTFHNSHKLGSKLSTISKGNRRNLDIR